MRRSENPTTGRSRRTNDRVLGLWRELRGNRAYPTPEDVISDANAEDAGGVGPNAFIIYFDGQPLESVFTSGSKVLESVCGTETRGNRITDCLPKPLGESMLGFVRTLAKIRKPIAVSSRFATDHGSEILYRSIYLPLSTDQDHVEYLLGAFSYKESRAA